MKLVDLAELVDDVVFVSWEGRGVILATQPFPCEQFSEFSAQLRLMTDTFRPTIECITLVS